MEPNQPQWEVELTVNGTPIDLNRFATSILGSTTAGMVASLKGVENPETIEVVVRKNPSPQS